MFALQVSPGRPRAAAHVWGKVARILTEINRLPQSACWLPKTSLSVCFLSRVANTTPASDRSGRIQLLCPLCSVFLDAKLPHLTQRIGTFSGHYEARRTVGYSSPELCDAQAAQGPVKLQLAPRQQSQLAKVPAVLSLGNLDAQQAHLPLHLPLLQAHDRTKNCLR